MSVAGDEIWVAAGIYQENIFIKSGIALYGGFLGSENDRDERNWEHNQTEISAANQGSTVTFARGVSANTRLDGFAITNGSGTLLRNYSYGGGIYCDDHSSPTIANNLITQNFADNGGGIFLYNFSRPVIVGNTITQNFAWDWGGGIYCWYDPATAFPNTEVPPKAVISDNTISSNRSAYGAGIAVFESAGFINMKPEALISDNRVYDNMAYVMDPQTTAVGGGIYCENISPANIINNAVVGNSADRSGGIHYSNSSGAIIGNRIAANFASFGGGMGVYHSITTIANNQVIGNDAYTLGGGIYAKGYSTSVFANNTIVSNVCDGSGGGVYMEDCDPSIINNLVAFNSAASGGGMIGVSSLATGATVPVAVSHNLLYRNQGGDYAGTVKRGDSDISFDPKLASIRYGNVHIQPGSPCINHGDNSVVQAGWLDMDGDNRIQGGTVDIGADESDGTVWTDAPAKIVCVSQNGLDDFFSYARTLHFARQVATRAKAGLSLAAHAHVV